MKSFIKVVIILFCLLIIIAAAGYLFFREKPKEARARVNKAEKEWNKIKNPIDGGFEKAKSALPETEENENSSGAR